MESWSFCFVVCPHPKPLTQKKMWIMKILIQSSLSISRVDSRLIINIASLSTSTFSLRERVSSSFQTTTSLHFNDINRHWVVFVWVAAMREWMKKECKKRIIKWWWREKYCHRRLSQLLSLFYYDDFITLSLSLCCPPTTLPFFLQISIILFITIANWKKTSYCKLLSW